MSLPVDIQYLTPEQNYLIADLARFTDQLAPYEGMGLCLQDMPIDNFSEDLRNLIREMIDKGLGSIKIWHVEHDTESGFDAIMFKDDYGHNGFTFGPTQGGLLDIDFNNDLAITLLNDCWQYKRAKKFFEKWKDDKCNNFLFGYSLGGNLALFIYREYAMYVNKVNVFDALPMQKLIMSEEDKVKINQWEKKGDIVHLIDLGSVDHSNEDDFSGNSRPLHDGILNEHTDDVGNSYFFDKNGNVVGGYSPLIEINTDDLRGYGIRLEKVQYRMRELESKLNNFNNPFNSLDTALLKVINDAINSFMHIFGAIEQALIASGVSDDIGKYCSYLFATADSFEEIERQIKLRFQDV